MEKNVGIERQGEEKRRTRAITGHAVLRSTSISPKKKRRNRATERRSDGWTDGGTDLLIEVLLST